MFQNIYGSPKICPNRNCKATLHKESHLGFFPKSETEVNCVIRCLECDDIFIITQMIKSVHQYYNDLPRKQCPEEVKNTPITLEEVESVKKTLSKSTFIPSSMRLMDRGQYEE